MHICHMARLLTTALFSLFTFASIIMGSTTAMAAPQISYELSMPEPHTHYFEVTISVKGWDKPSADLKMATWTPGSYLIREYAKNVEGVAARSVSGVMLATDKINKNTWRIETNGIKDFTFNYKVYAFELTVRNAFVDASHAYLNPAAVFMVVAGKESQATTLTIKPHTSFKKISTALVLKPGTTYEYQVPDWDTFVDSPIEIGNHDTFSFTAAGVPHEVAIYGGGNYDQARLKKDMAKIVETATAIFGEHPCDHYVFIVHNIPNGSGGLEHKYSTTLQANPFGYQDERSYANFMGLVAHEYFHLWNVKRLRPAALGPFNYDEENYTHSLWVAEGITSYYDDHILLRAGLIGVDRYLEIVASTFGAIDNTPGSKVQTLAESSFDAWIKYYRPNENSNNATVGYYTKGACVGILLDLKIRTATSGRKSLDDVMKLMYDRYYKKAGRGYTEAEFEKAAAEVAGIKLDDFFDTMLRSTTKLDLKAALSEVGLDVKDQNASRNDAWLGANLNNQNGRWVISSVIRNSPAWHDGLSVNDEVIGLNDYRLTSDWSEILRIFRPGDKIKVLVARAGLLMNIDVTLSRNPNVNYRIATVRDAQSSAAALGDAWLCKKK